MDDLKDVVKLNKLRNLTKKANKERQRNHDKENLKRHLKKKFKTTMIGSLARFEETFGHFWGHGVPEEDLSEHELENKRLWELVRTEVLNNGNNQLRAALSEVDNYTIEYNKLKYDFIIKDKQGE